MSDINYIIKKFESYLIEKNYIGLIKDKDLAKIKKFDKNIINNLHQYTEDEKAIKIITDYYNLKEFDFYKTLELDLLKLYKETNDKKIRNFICMMNVNLVKKFANLYKCNDNFDDLYQVGTIALIDGIDKFDCSFSSKLSTYVCYWIESQIKNYSYNLDRTIKKPVNIGNDKSKLNKFINSFYKNNGYYPSVNEIAEATSFSQKKIKDLQNNIEIFSIDEQLRTDYNEQELLDWYSLIANDEINLNETIESKERQTIIKELITNLSPDQQYIILHRYGFDNNDIMTFQEISDDLNVSRQAVEQNEKRALEKLKKKINAKKYHI